jgi:hypothetical protein
MESFDANGSGTITSSIPQGLIEPEKNIDESQMAEFSTPLDEVIPQQQEMAFGMASQPQQQVQQQVQQPQTNLRKIPFGLTSEQYMAVLAGLAAVVATSKPVQERVGQFFPSVEMGSMSAMGLTAILAALVFFLAHRFLN